MTTSLTDEEKARLQEKSNPFAKIYVKDFADDLEVNNLTIPAIYEKEARNFSRILSEIEESGTSSTLILKGDMGAGKSHFLGRMMNEHKKAAVFVRVRAFQESRILRRHVLRFLVGQLTRRTSSSPLCRLQEWLLALCPRHGVKEPGSSEKQGDRVLKIRQLMQLEGLAHAAQLASPLAALWDTDLMALTASAWLGGELLADDQLQSLGVESSVSGEEFAFDMIENILRLCPTTQTVVFCFDQLDDIERRLGEDSINLGAILSLNSTLHNSNIPHFLLVVSIVEDTYQKCLPHLLKADLARIDNELQLVRFGINIGKELIKSRLASVHELLGRGHQSTFPFCESDLNEKFFGDHQVHPRQVIEICRKHWRQLLESPETSETSFQKGTKEFQKIPWPAVGKSTLASLTRQPDFSSREIVEQWKKWLEHFGYTFLSVNCLHEKADIWDLSMKNSKGKKLGVIPFDSDDGRVCSKIAHDIETRLQQGVWNEVIFVRHGGLRSTWKVSIEILNKWQGKKLLFIIDTSANDSKMTNLKTWVAAWSEAARDFANGDAVFDTETIYQAEDFENIFLDFAQWYQRDIPTVLELPTEIQFNSPTRPKQAAKQEQVAKQAEVADTFVAREIQSTLVALLMRNRLITFSHLLKNVRVQYPAITESDLLCSCEDICSQRKAMWVGESSDLNYRILQVKEN